MRCRRSERHVGFVEVDVDVACGGERRAAFVTQHLLDLQTAVSPDVLAQFVQDLEDRDGQMRSGKIIAFKDTCWRL